VGITVQIEPRVHHNKEVTLKVQVEVSQVTGTVETSSGQSQPIIGTRQIQSVLRLRDGETSVLAGLIKEEDTDTQTGIAGIMDIPGLGRLLSNKNSQATSTDIIMTLTPQIIRMPDITDEDLATLWVGTEENMRLRGPTRGVFGVTAFGNGDIDAGAAGGGTISTISSSDEARRDQEERERELGEQDEEDAGTVEESAETTDQGDTATDDTPEQPTGPALVRMVVGSAQVRVGDPVTVQVFIENGFNVGSVPFHLSYDREVMEYLDSYSEGEFLKADGTNTIHLATPAAGGGEVVVGHSRMGGTAGASGAGLLGTYQFQATGPGTCTFSFLGASVKDPQARNLPASFMPVSVQIVE
jgi:general secretion pathway protein D